MATIDTRTVLTTAQAAEQLGIHTDSVQKLCQRGVIKGVKAGKEWLVPKAEVKRYQRDRKPAGRPPRKSS